MANLQPYSRIFHESFKYLYSKFQYHLFHRKPLPSFDATVNGVNELDLKIQEIRIGELAGIVEEASKLREQATDVNEAMEEVNNYLNRLHDVALEV